MHSPRSTRGTTRRIVYWNASRPGTLSLLDEDAWWGQPPLQEFGEVGSATVSSLPEPLGGDLRGRLLHGLCGDVGESLVGACDRFRALEQDVLADQRERRARRGRQRCLAVLAVEGCPVIDEPCPPMPEQQVGVARRAIDVHHQRVEPHHIGRPPRIESVACGGRERQRSGEEIDPEVGTDGGGGTVLNLDIWLGLGKRGI